MRIKIAAIRNKSLGFIAISFLLQYNNNQIIKVNETVLLLVPDHSLLKLFTGFASAALIAWKLTVISAITTAAMPAAANTHQ